MTHPIAPPPELVQQWIDAPHDIGLGCHPARFVPNETYAKRLIEAAQWGADQELEAIIKLADGASLPEEDRYFDGVTAASLRAQRRPQPPSLKEQALGLLNEGPVSELLDHEVDTIRRALEQLDD